MAFTAATGEDKVSRSDIFAVAPRAIVVDWGRNLSRQGKEPPIDDDLMHLGQSMLPRDKGGRGQINPITVRPLPDRRLEIVDGFRRLRAALWLVESGTCPDFKILYVVRKVTDAEAALDNLAENIERLALDRVQLAHAIRSLEESYLMPVSEIAAKFHRSESWVAQTRDLVCLPEPIQAAVTNGSVSVSAALALNELPAEERDSLFDAAKASGEPLKASQVKAKQREVAAKSPGTKAPSRTLREVKDFIESKTGSGEPLASSNLASSLLDWISGTLTDSDMEGAWDGAFSTKKKGAKVTS
jgi:ParB/RepB/Spo0J family partition protein